MSVTTNCACGTCLTCTGAPPRRPVADPLVFRHAAIKARLLSQIATTEIDGGRPLDLLGTREDDDPAIALIDATAGALHVLAWNTARLADDGTLRRTEDRDALVDLTRLLGYEPRPALAATTTLAFTVDAFEGSTLSAIVPKGTKVASVPGKDELPQTFETDAQIEARPEWNALRPVQQPDIPLVSSATTSITIAGAATTAKPGDLVLVYLEPQTSHSWLVARIHRISREPGLEPPRTVIDLTGGAGLTTNLASIKGAAFKNQVVVLGQRASAFGATAPDMNLMPEQVQGDHGTENPAGNWEWTNLVMPGGTPATVDLDAVYADAMTSRLVLFTRADAAIVREPGLITSAVELSRKGFGLSAKVTRIIVDGIDGTDTGFRNKVRETAIFIETARETLLVEEADVEMPPAAGPSDRLTVPGTVALPVGRRVVVTGELFTPTVGQPPDAAEVATVKSATSVDAGTELVFERGLAHTYRSTTIVLHANAVSASHGDTPVTPLGSAELIGSATASTPSPGFPLKRAPLAYVPADTVRGYAPAIDVRVGDRLYTEVPTLYGLDSNSRAYTVKTTREGSAVQFAGRLPSGTHNVTATYRTGGGTGGNLNTGRITTIMTPVLGVRSATNLVPADGGSDAESIDDLRSAAPQSIRTLDRVVSLADFEAAARTYRGVGKALATELHVGMRSVVCLTLATTTLDEPGTDLIEDLRKTLAQVTVPGRTVRIEGFVDLTANVTAALAIDSAFRRADIESAARTVLDRRFGRPARRFGEALHRSAVLAALHEVTGVIAATLTTFELPGGPPEDEGRLLCPAPSFADGVFQKAGLLSIDAAAVQFAEMQP